MVEFFPLIWFKYGFHCCCFCIQWMCKIWEKITTGRKLIEWTKLRKIRASYAKTVFWLMFNSIYFFALIHPEPKCVFSHFKSKN